MNRQTITLYFLAVFAGILILTGYMAALHRDWWWAAGYFAVGGYGAWWCWREYRAL